MPATTDELDGLGFGEGGVCGKNEGCDQAHLVEVGYFLSRSLLGARWVPFGEQGRVILGERQSPGVFGINFLSQRHQVMTGLCPSGTE